MYRGVESALSSEVFSSSAFDSSGTTASVNVSYFKAVVELEQNADDSVPVFNANFTAIG